MNRKLKNFAKNFIRNIFVFCQKFGFNILPCHFYSQIPNIKTLSRNRFWNSPLEMIGINGSSIASQENYFTSACAHADPSEFFNLYNKAIEINGQGGGYGEIETQFLYCFIKKEKPSKIVQVGCGVSTAVMLAALSSSLCETSIICIEPYPSEYLKDLSQKNKIHLIEEHAQHVDLDYFTSLKSGDFLFIDSTHTVKPGSEVNRIVLDILPRLLPGVFIHFHDIYFPYDFKRDLIRSDLFFWTESTLVHSFLINNSKASILVSLSMLHYQNSSLIKKFFSDYDPQENDGGLEVNQTGHFPSSAYLITA